MIKNAEQQRGEAAKPIVEVSDGASKSTYPISFN